MMMKVLFLICLVFGFTQFVFSDSEDENRYWHGKVRELRYQPDGEDFVIINGDRKFNRALYGYETNRAFRVETGDVPEFGLFMARMGGNLHFGLISGDESKWLNDAEHIESRYRAGARLYEIKDPLLGDGSIKMHVLAMDNADGLIMSVEFENVPEEVELMWVYGGASNSGFWRSGDLGVDPEDSFELKSEACRNNVYSINENQFNIYYGVDKKHALAASRGELDENDPEIQRPRIISGVFPDGSELRVGDPENRHTPIEAWKASGSTDLPILLGRRTAENAKVWYMSLHNPDTRTELSYEELADLFDVTESKRSNLASRIAIHTPDPFFNTLGGTMVMAADAIWEPHSFLHGAVGWRMRLNGWRGPYVADVFGWHDRARGHFNGYANSQITEVPPIYPHPTQDMELNMTRAEKRWGTQMYSNGYICRNPNRNDQMHHYDMNLCYIDELLWHFNWTGDLEYVEKMWPVLELHLEWEKRNFDPNDDGLYDAYASIWASDGLMYNSGGVTHSSAYNFRANKLAAELAELLGKDPTPYRQEAEKILSAINSRLWMNDRGWWAEYVDFMGHQKIHPNAAIWTVYHAIDSEVHDNFQGYQAVRYVDKEIPHIDVNAKGLEDGYQTISTTNWMPYTWSINNVAFAEVGHTALSFWQAGSNEKAFHLLKSSLLDGMYLGASPGNIGQISFYDAARGESYRDFADPVGVTSRTVIQGLYGIIPDALNNKVLIRPGFPDKWDYASLSTPYIKYDYRQDSSKDNYEFELSFQKELALELQVRARLDQVQNVLVNGRSVEWKVLDESVGQPEILIDCGIETRYQIEIIWDGSPVNKTVQAGVIAQNDLMAVEFPTEIHEIYDPQGVLSDVRVNGKTLEGNVKGLIGHRTLFAKTSQGDLAWWLPVELEVKDPLVVEVVNAEVPELDLRITNYSQTPFNGVVEVNGFKEELKIEGNGSSVIVGVTQKHANMGTNRVVVNERRKRLFGWRETLSLETSVINWELSNGSDVTYEPVDMGEYFNDNVAQIFKNEYLSPRSPYTTMQTPKQGIGEWCHPLTMAEIDDSGLPDSNGDGLLKTDKGLIFNSKRGVNNIAYTTLWDNYPEKIEVDLDGRSSHAYLLMTGSTNHMHSRFVNGEVRVVYTDGTIETLELINPESWFPIEQDYFVDGEAFRLNAPRPYRIQLKTGLVSRNLGDELGITGVEPRRIEGGAAVILDIPLNKNKELERLEVESLANEVVIGLMGITLVR